MKRVVRLTPEQESFYAGFTPMRTTAHKPLAIGDRVRIVGDHPHEGREGRITNVIRLLGKPAVEIRFDDRDGCFVTDPKKHWLQRAEIGKRRR